MSKWLPSSSDLKDRLESSWSSLKSRLPAGGSSDSAGKSDGGNQQKQQGLSNVPGKPSPGPFDRLRSASAKAVEAARARATASKDAWSKSSTEAFEAAKARSVASLGAAKDRALGVPQAMWQKTKEQAAWGPNFLRRSTATASRRVVMVIFGGLFCYGLGTAIPGAVSKYLVSRNRGDDAKRLKDGGDKAS